MYELKERHLTSSQYKKVLSMNIPNDDEDTNDELWISNADCRVDRDWENTDKVIDLILKQSDSND